MATPQTYKKLAEGLPKRLKFFFQRWPHPALLSNNEDALNNIPPPIDTPESRIGNPFKAQKHPVTGKWHDPIYSLRRQADLVKLARTHGVEELLPHTVKGTQYRIQRRMENGLRVKGTGVGQKVKGKEHERTLKQRLEKRRQAMLDMPKMIQTWKERGHGRGWKKWPK